MLLLNDFISLIFPELCAVCGSGLYKGEQDICTACLFKLPQTGFHKLVDNPVAKLFWGRIELNAAASFYLFQKGGSVQELIHQLKYRGQKQIGVTIGKQYGHEIKQSVFFKDADLIIPVPLHKTRLRKRGYNQAEYFAKGLSEVMNVGENFSVLKKIISVETQTKKSRFNRWKNVETVFKVENAEMIKGKHILLVDDVVTTGATLEACAEKLIKAGAGKVSVATIAFTQL